MRQQWLRLLWAASWLAALALAPAETVHAQLIGAGERTAAIEIAVVMARQKITATNAERTRTNSALIEERLKLASTNMYVFDPRLFKLSLAGDFGLSQEWLTSPGSQVSREGTLRGYEADLAVLGEQATSLNLFASRDQSLLLRELAGRSEAINEDRGMTLFARRLPLPSTLTWRQELQEEESRTGDVFSRRDDRRNIFTYEGSRGWVDRELSLRYEFVDLTAEVLPNLSYNSHEGSVLFSSDFGPELNRHWDSQARYFTRAGQTDLTTLTVDEGLRFEHSEQFQTEGRYFLLSTETVGGTSTTHTATLRAHRQFYDNLRTTLGGDASFLTLPGGDEDIFRSQLDAAYTKRLPGAGTLNAGLGGRIEYQDNRFEGTESFVPQETHTFATPNAVPVTLSNPFIDTSSLVVTKVTLGPLPPGCLTPSGPPVPLVLGRDYTLLTVGDVIQVVPVACVGATPGINPGDTIAVDYRFKVSPALAFNTEGWRADLSVDYRWVRPYVAYQQTAQHLRSGRDEGLLDDQQSDAVGIEFRKDGQRVHANLVGELSRFTSTRLNYDRLRSTQFLSYSPLPEVTLNVSGEEGRLNFDTPDHQIHTVMGQVSLTYAASANLLAEASVGTRWLNDTVLPDERHAQATARLRWILRALEISPRFDWFNRRRGDTLSDEYRLFLHVIRRF
ncbi:MAG: hypothetical protein HY352_01180 [Candidatus Omnitrophica bacterium]|nr:hypothetical protein [Candidatus Omnitrophota bacterium]